MPNLFTSGLGCTSSKETETDGGAGGSLTDLAVPEMVDAAVEPEMADMAVPPVADSTVPDVGASDVTVGDVSVADVTVADVTVADAPSDGPPADAPGPLGDGSRPLFCGAASEVCCANDTCNASLTCSGGKVCNMPGEGLETGWQCTDESDCMGAGAGYGWACCLKTGGTGSTCTAIVNGNTDPCTGAALCKNSTDTAYCHNVLSPGVFYFCIPDEGFAFRYDASVPLYRCSETESVGGDD